MAPTGNLRTMAEKPLLRSVLSMGVHSPAGSHGFSEHLATSTANTVTVTFAQVPLVTRVPARAAGVAC